MCLVDKKVQENDLSFLFFYLFNSIFFFVFDFFSSI